MRRWIGGTVAGLLVMAGLAAGSGVALAADGGTAGKPDRICTERIPRALTRIDTLIARIGGDASTKGSTAWLSERAQKVRATGHPALADLLEQRAKDRPARVADLQQLKAQLQDVQAKDCAA